MYFSYFLRCSLACAAFFAVCNINEELTACPKKNQCSSGAHCQQHSWQHEQGGICTDNVLQQFYPDQNACRLTQTIPSSLAHLSCAIYPTSIGYDTARFNFNKRYNIFPHAIFTPRHKSELVHIFKELKKHHLHFSIRSGGHCIEPGSLTSDYVIDLRNFNWVVPNFKRQELSVGAAVRLGSIIEALGKHNYAIPTGTCSSVGVGGLALGGGLGFLGRVYGLTCDSIKSITILTADGRVIKASKTKHPDLFWALRGAGNGSYGIVLGFTFKIHHIPKVSYYQLSWKWNAQKVEKIFQAWQSWIKTLPKSITTQLQLKYIHGELFVDVVGLKVSKESFFEWKKGFEHLHPTVSIKKLSFLKSAQFWADRSIYPFFKSKSEMLMKPLSKKPIQTAIAFFETLKKNKNKYYAFFELEALGGQIAKNKNTAYFPRKAIAWWYQVVYWKHENQEHLAVHKLQKFHAAIKPYVSKYAYANISDYSIGKDYLKVYYGNHVDQLIKIKEKYDPDNLFHWRQSIPVK